jgi:hypothetical protein
MGIGQAGLGLARKQLDDALRLRRELGDRMGTTHSRVNLGELAMAQGDPRLAGLRLEEALAILRDVGDRSGRADVLGYLGQAAAMQRDFAAACACHAENLTVRREFGQWLALSAVLEDLATLAWYARRWPAFGAPWGRRRGRRRRRSELVALNRLDISFDSDGARVLTVGRRPIRSRPAPSSACRTANSRRPARCVPFAARRIAVPGQCEASRLVRRRRRRRRRLRAGRKARRRSHRRTSALTGAAQVVR